MQGLWVVLGLIAVGYPLRAGLRRLGTPPAVSLMALGLLAGPDVLDVIPASYTETLASPLSRAAFAVLLVRAGFGLAPGALRAILGAALAFGTFPVAAEMVVVYAGGRLWLFEDARLCWLLAFLIAAVSPAVILPTMLEQKDLGRGGPHLVPDRIMGQTVINAFIAQTGILFVLSLLVPAFAGSSPLWPDWPLPLTLILAVVLGIGVATALGKWLPVRPLIDHAGSTATATVAVLGLLVYFAANEVGLESVFATLALGVALRRRFPESEPSLRVGLKQVWGFAEILLFANLGMRIPIGALVDLRLLGIVLSILIVGVGLRIVVALLMARGAVLDRRESLYVGLSQIPKATIQAVFGALPLQMFLEAGAEDLVPAGEVMLVAAALAICATAPVGAVALDRWAEKLLGVQRQPNQLRD